VLLSDLRGNAITGLRIKGVLHEFSRISSFKEDIVDIVLNLKSIVLRGPVLRRTETLIARLNYRGPGIITSGDIELPAGIEMVFPNQYIATALDNQLVCMDFHIQCVTGYKIRHAAVLVPEAFIKVDSVYMPVIRFNFFVESVTTQREFEDFESLVLEVTTDGSITPEDAIRKGFRRLFRLLEVFWTDLSCWLAPLPSSKRKKRRRISKAEGHKKNLAKTLK
jgi:DNA-directed RNA polymerase subunit alpha